MNIDLDTGHPPDPEYLQEVAKAFAETVRVMNHLTRDHAAIRYPAEADRLVRAVSSAVSRLPQLLGQLAAWLDAEEDTGRIEVTRGEYAGNPVTAVAAARRRLDGAGGQAAALQEMLDWAAQVTATLGAPETEEGGSDG